MKGIFPLKKTGEKDANEIKKRKREKKRCSNGKCFALQGKDGERVAEKERARIAEEGSRLYPSASPKGGTQGKIVGEETEDRAKKE